MRWGAANYRPIREERVTTEPCCIVVFIMMCLPSSDDVNDGDSVAHILQIVNHYDPFMFATH